MPMSKTVHVIPSERGWMVAREGDKKAELFLNKKDAIARARVIVKRIAPAQGVVHTKDGRTASVWVRGMPRIPQSPFKSSLGSANIERAIFELVRQRLPTL
jgi:hypothetical protein